MSLPRTTQVVCIATLMFCGLGAAKAADVPASDASVRELIQVTRVQDLLKTTSEEMNGYMAEAMDEALEGAEVSKEQRQIIDEMRAKIQNLFKETLSWKEFEPLVLDVYKRTFNQREVDGMVAFYKTEVGKAVVDKMPLVTTNTMEAMQGRMAQILPALQKLQEETLNKLNVAK